MFCVAKSLGWLEDALIHGVTNVELVEDELCVSNTNDNVHHGP